MNDQGVYLEMKDYHRNDVVIKEADYDTETVWMFCTNPKDDEPQIILTAKQAKKVIQALQKFVEWSELPEGEHS